MIRERAIVNKLLPFLLTGISLLAFNNLYAQRPIFRTFNVEIEAEKARVQAMAQDDNNFLYLGTDKGLARYNGNETTPVYMADSIAIASITSLCMTSDNKLWIGGAKGELNIHSGDSVVKFTNASFHPSSKITQIYEAEGGTIWIATYGEGIFFLENGSVYNLTVEDGLSDNYTYSIYESNDHRIWIGTDAGISQYDPGNSSFSYLSTKNGLPDNIVRVIIASDQGEEVWIAMQDSGICIYNTTRNEFNRPFVGGLRWKYGAVASMIIDMKGDVWAGTTRKGVVKITQTENVSDERLGKKISIRLFSESNGLAGNEITSLLEDNEKNVWIGTRGGSSQYSRSPFEYLTKADGLTSNNVYALLVDAQDNLWICTEREVIKYAYEPMGDVSITTYLSSEGRLNQQTVSIFEDDNNLIWMGTYGNGVYVLDPKTDKITHYSENNGLNNNNVMSITQDDQGNIWLATLGGVSKLTASGSGLSNFTITNYTQEDGLGSNYVYSVYYDGKNYLWFATDGGGISKHNKKEFLPVLFPNEMASKTNYSITTDRRGALWFSNAEGGIYKYESGKLVNYNEDKGLRDNTPGILTTGIKDEIIVAHRKGIDIMAHGEKVFQGFNPDWKEFEFDPNLNAFYCDEIGNVWIGTSNGIVKFNYLADEQEEESPIIILNNIRVMEKRIEVEDGKEYAYNENHFSFQFLGVWLKSPETVTYRYKLEGYEENWSRVTSERFVSYANLPYGEYTFKVKSRAASGSWNEIPKTHSFIIHPPFWKTWWFNGIAIITIWLLSYLTYIQRMKYLQASNIVLKRRVKENKEEIDRLKSELEEANETYVQ